MPRPNPGPRLVWLKKRKRWYIRTCEAGRTRDRSTGTAEREEAEEALARFIDARRARAPSIGPSHPSEFSIAEALDFYASLHAPQTQDPARIGYAIEALLPFWQNLNVADITETTCNEYARYRDRGNGTVRRELGTLRAAINYAQRYARITTAPFVFLPEKPPGRSRVLSREEAAALLWAGVRSRADSRLYLPLFIVLALYTGARKEAILSLRWPQVDLERRRIDFNVPGRRQTNKRRAILPIPDRLFTFLTLARRRGEDLGYVVHNGGSRIKDIKKSFARACRDAALDDVTPHTLRHTCGTWLAQQGVDLWEIAGWLGQTHARTTELYAHHHPDHLSNASRAVDRRRA